MWTCYAIGIVVFFCGLCSCERFSLPENDYSYFAITEVPEEERIWYPEEEMIFTFSQAVDAGTLGAVTISYEDDPVHETIVLAEENRVIVKDLLPDAVLSVTFTSALKSVEHKPLVTLSDNGELLTSPFSFSFTVGPALPQMAKVFPGDSVRSSSIALQFTGPIEALEHFLVTPSPLKYYLDGDLLLLVFEGAPSSLRVEGLSSPLRPGMVPPVVLSLREDPADPVAPSILEAVSDTSVVLTVSGEGLVAVAVKNDVTVCSPQCLIVQDSLSPDTRYTFDLSLFFTDGARDISYAVQTLPAAPHIMISEIMHTPEDAPEKNFEFVEIYNHGDLDFDLAACTIDDKGDGIGEDRISPFLEGDTSIAPGEFALILGAESTVHLSLSTHPHVFFVDDTTIADGGLTSTESIQITCSSERGMVTVASYNGLFRGAPRGYSVIISPDGHTCASEKAGGSPGEIEYCAP